MDSIPNPRRHKVKPGPLEWIAGGIFTFFLAMPFLGGVFLGALIIGLSALFPWIEGHPWPALGIEVGFFGGLLALPVLALLILDAIRKLVLRRDSSALR